MSRKIDTPENNLLPFLEEKALYFSTHLKISQRKRWYFKNYENYKLKLKLRRHIRFMLSLKLPKYFSFFRWIYVDFLRGKSRKFWGIYQFVALPGEGKTLSMVAQMERIRADIPDIVIASNFGYKYNTFFIHHWTDIIKAAKYAQSHNRYCVIAMDEIHVTFDSSDWKSFPPELLALLSFNRKYNLEFLCSAQIYDRIPKKIRDIANYTVICKNVMGADRLFRNYYYSKTSYDDKFSGKPAKAEFIRDFIADDDLYLLYDTTEQVDRMVSNAQAEKDARQHAFDLLFGQLEQEEAPPISEPAQ